jgi:hypothetical protein
MNWHAFIDFFLGGYVIVDAVKYWRGRYRAWKAVRALPGMLWWYKWNLTWAAIGVTEMCRIRVETPEDLDEAAGLRHASEDLVFTRRTSNTHSAETPQWNPMNACWEESDAMLRERIAATLKAKGN